MQHVVRITGLSYMLFRQIHVLVDASQGQIERISLWSYVNYQVNLFTILAGPIQRYQDFHEQWQTLQPVLADPQELLQNCLRLLLGVLKIALIAPLFYKGWDELQVALDQSCGFPAGSISSSSWWSSISIRSIFTAISPATATS